MKLLAAAVIVLVLALAQYAWFQAPCGLWKYSKAGEMPARCVMHR
ncbi:hypothetical protein [Streptomyces californicus]